MDMYNVIAVDANVEINGFPFFAKEIKANEAYNRRELSRKKIKMGTEFVARADYIPREYTFNTSVEIPVERPDVHDSVFIDIMNSPAEVICPDMGGLFKAQVIIKTTHSSSTPNMLDLEVSVKEIPEQKSNIPNDEVGKLDVEVLKTQEEANLEHGKNADGTPKEEIK
ncbi:hypothetical protein [uncultured Methanobrevibacter sp.]|uniref:hypothetical protein n=1 Tax=uncultured Methanobrevibacter sp. TaxID=253161 RepID=UPI002625CC40|nr:hypothetical protein [uncultured Methanobrevibacter sp.]